MTLRSSDPLTTCRLSPVTCTQVTRPLCPRYAATRLPVAADRLNNGSAPPSCVTTTTVCPSGLTASKRMGSTVRTACTNK